MGVAVAVPECRPGLWVWDLNLKFKGNGKILMFKQNVFSKVGPKKSQATCFKSEHSGSKGVPGSGSQSICTERPGWGWGGQGVVLGTNCPQNQEWASLALRSTEGQHLTFSRLQSVSRNLFPSPNQFLWSM